MSYSLRYILHRDTFEKPAQANRPGDEKTMSAETQLISDYNDLLLQLSPRLRSGDLTIDPLPGLLATYFRDDVRLHEPESLPWGDDWSGISGLVGEGQAFRTAFGGRYISLRSTTPTIRQPQRWSFTPSVSPSPRSTTPGARACGAVQRGTSSSTGRCRPSTCSTRTQPASWRSSPLDQRSTGHNLVAESAHPARMGGQSVGERVLDTPGIQLLWSKHASDHHF